MKGPVTKEALFAALAVIAALAPFMGKAFHIDEPLFMWMAQQISRHPLDPYGFSVNWYAILQPIFLVMENPPLSSFYAALVARVLGWSEPAMHVGFLVPAIAAIIGTFFLARRLTESPSASFGSRDIGVSNIICSNGRQRRSTPKTSKSFQATFLSCHSTAQIFIGSLV